MGVSRCGCNTEVANPNLNEKNLMKAKEADISVVVPLYNHERYVIATLESVFNQSVRPREVIVVDDGSNDGSLELVRSVFADKANLVLWSKPNAGAHHTINAGIYRATSANVAILNSDDIFEPDRLQICLELLEKNKEAAVVCTGITFIDGAGHKIPNDWYRQAYEYYLANGDLALALINGNFLMTTSNFVIRRSAFEKYGYFGNFRYTHDLAFLLRLLAKDVMIHVDPRPLLQYRIHSSNTISEGVMKVKVEWAAVIAEYIMQLYQLNQRQLTADYLSKLYAILDTHNLSRMLFPLMGAMAVKAPDGWGVDKLLADADFSKSLHTIAK